MGLLTEICYDSKCPLQVKYPHYIDESPIPDSDTRVNWELEQIKHRRGNVCWKCKTYLTPKDQDHTFCNPCWNRMNKDDICTVCGEFEEYGHHIFEPYVPDYMDEGN